MALSVPRGQLRQPHRIRAVGPADAPLGRIDVEIRDDGQIWAVGRSE